MASRTPRTARPRFESLEGRSLMAGNVTVSLFVDPNGPDDLLIEGDSAANEIEITETLYSYVITPKNGTWINNFAPGQAFYQIRSHVTGDIVMSPGGGNDVLEVVTGVTAPRGLVVDLGAGDDVAEVRNSTFKNYLNVYRSADNDYVRADGVTVGGFGVVGAQNDLLVDLGENSTGFASDEVWVSNTDVARDLDLRLGIAAIKKARVDAGSDVGRDLLISSGVGFADVDLVSSSVSRDVRINTGHSVDYITLNDMDVARDVVIDAGSGNNNLTLNHAAIQGHLNVNAGGGRDTVRISSTSLGSRRGGQSNYISLGAGNDSLIIRATSAPSLFLDGGANFDSLAIYDAALIALLTGVNFEESNL